MGQQVQMASLFFYQKYWDIIKWYLVELFSDYFNNNLDIFSINFATITLIPKEDDARIMKKFRPISLLNCNFKFFTEVLTNKMSKVVNRLISPCQSVFIRGRFILES